jgi:hypothetical protein
MFHTAKRWQKKPREAADDTREHQPRCTGWTRRVGRRLRAADMAEVQSSVAMVHGRRRRRRPLGRMSASSPIGKPAGAGGSAGKAGHVTMGCTHDMTSGRDRHTTRRQVPRYVVPCANNPTTSVRPCPKMRATTADRNDSRTTALFPRWGQSARPSPPLTCPS